MADLEVFQLEHIRGVSPAIVCLPGEVVAGAAILLHSRRAGGPSSRSCGLPSLRVKSSRSKVRHLASALAMHMA